MANIAISELDTETTSLGDNDLLLVSKDNGGSYTSAKMKGSVLKGGVSGCQFSEDVVKNALTRYNVPNIDNITAINEKLDSLSAELKTLSISQKENFDLLIELDTKIGNKVFGLEGGEISPTEEYTLTLNKIGINNAIVDGFDDPTGGGIYKKGTRTVIKASDASYPFKFMGWYVGDTLLTTGTSYSYEVKDNVTLTAKYDMKTYGDDYYISCYLNCLNYSSFDVYTDIRSMLYKIPKQTYGTPFKAITIFFKMSDSDKVFQYLTTLNIEDNDKIKISLSPEYDGAKNWDVVRGLHDTNNKGITYWFSRFEGKNLPQNGDTLPGVFVIEDA